MTGQQGQTGLEPSERVASGASRPRVPFLDGHEIGQPRCARLRDHVNRRVPVELVLLRIGAPGSAKASIPFVAPREIR
jgi:hypothetical protein